MYLPKHFEQHEPGAIAALVREQPLAMIVRHGNTGLDADPIPLLFDAADGADDTAGALRGTLRGHVARANPLWRDAHERDVLAIFQGPQAYVSPGWYPSKREHGKAVPTWNYAVVQMHGRLRAVDDPAWLRAFVTRLTDANESHRAARWHVSDAPPDYLDQMLRAIVGLEIEVTRVVAKWKVSQNRSAADREGTAEGLLADGQPAMAALVRGS